MNKIVLTAFLFLPSVIPSFGAAFLINNFSFEQPTTADGDFLTGPESSSLFLLGLAGIGIAVRRKRA